MGRSTLLPVAKDHVDHLAPAGEWNGNSLSLILVEYNFETEYSFPLLYGI